MAPFQARIRCPQAQAWNTDRQLSEYTPYLESQNIKLVTQVQIGNVEKFLTEYYKFPTVLSKELIGANARIHLMEGEGVTVDFTWPQLANTFDGRSWSQVPGAGGSPNGHPTRVVINHLYDRHGSVNLVLHEHGHTLDQLYKQNVISKSKSWKKLMEAEPQVQQFMLNICGSYCKDNINEGFAELFAFYHACAETKALVEREIPGFARFLQELTNVKAFKYDDDQL